MRKKGQISIELLLVILIIMASLAIIVPNIFEVKETGNYAINMRNAQLILDKITSACERALITGSSREKISVWSLTTYTIKTKGSTLTLSFHGLNGTETIKEQLDFSCVADLEIPKGQSDLMVEYAHGSVRLSYTNS